MCHISLFLNFDCRIVQIFEADVSLMLYWYAFGDVNQLDSELLSTDQSKPTASAGPQMTPECCRIQQSENRFNFHRV